MVRLDMLPGFAIDNHAHIRSINSVDRGDVSLGFSITGTSSNIQHLNIGQLGSAARLATQDSLWMQSRPVRFAAGYAPLRGGIFIIVIASTKKQMSRPDAGWIVAAMEHPKSYRNWTAGKFPCNPVRARLMSMCLDSEHAVSKPPSICQPDPTRANFLAVRRDWSSLIYFCPEALSDGHDHGLCIACVRTEFLRRIRGGKDRAALDAESHGDSRLSMHRGPTSVVPRPRLFAQRGGTSHSIVSCRCASVSYRAEWFA